VKLEASGYLAKEVHGISARPGSFAFREALVERGGSVRAQVSIDGAPAAGIRCAVVDVPGQGAPASALRLVVESRAGEKGVFLADGVPAGRYVLRVFPSGEQQGAVDEQLTVFEGQLTTAEVSLQRLKVQGHVDHAGEPVAEAVVEIHKLDSVTMVDRQAPSKPVTNADGLYEADLWQPGEYWFILQPAGGAPADSKRTWVSSEGATVDFHLAKGRVVGAVVDDAGRGIEAAAVQLTQNRTSHRLARTDDMGRFEFYVSGEGTLTLQALKRGYKRSDQLAIPVPTESDSSVTLRLSKLDSVRGLVTSTAGTPLSGITTATFVQNALGVRLLDSGTTDMSGKFDLVRASGGVTFLATAGIQCPLKIGAVEAEADDVVVTCSAAPAALNVILKDHDGSPMVHESFLFRRGGVVIPRGFLLQHLISLGLPVETDAGGFMAIVMMEPGEYELFLLKSSSEQTIAAGSAAGFLTAISVGPYETTELDVRVETESSRK
jgi:hypothetical protein